MAADNVTRAVNAWSAALLPQPAKPARKRAKR
jgi:hypothetical protein